MLRDLFRSIVWHLLPQSWYAKIPDDCAMRDCARKGVWGNENVITLSSGVRITLCDQCTSRYLTERATAIRGGSIDVELAP